MNIRSLKFCGLLAIVAGLLFSSVASPVLATGYMLNDQFNYLSLKPENNANWWLINWGPDGDTQGRVEGYCGTATCILPMSDNNDHFARLSIQPTVGGYYINADMAELHTGFPSEGQGRWTPSLGHSVVVEATVRWSANYLQDGTGGAIGTNGVWLWNSPIDLTDPNSAMQQTAIGFNWADQSMLSGYLAGLKANVIVNSFPYAVNRPTSAINMQDWVNLKMVWSQDANGTQTVNYMVNNEDLGTTTLPYALSNLSVEIWNDNSNAQFNEEGGVTILHPAITQNQYFDVSSVKVYQQD